jgi:hypothetical protein
MSFLLIAGDCNTTVQHVPAGPLQEWLMCGPKAASTSAPLL